MNNSRQASVAVIDDAHARSKTWCKTGVCSRLQLFQQLLHQHQQSVTVTHVFYTHTYRSQNVQHTCQLTSLISSATTSSFSSSLITFHDHVSSPVSSSSLSQHPSFLHSFIRASQRLFFTNHSLHRLLIPSGEISRITGLFIGFSMLNDFLFTSVFLSFSSH